MNCTKSSLIYDFQNYRLPQKRTLKSSTFRFHLRHLMLKRVRKLRLESILQKNSWQLQNTYCVTGRKLICKCNDGISIDEEIGLERINSIALGTLSNFPGEFFCLKTRRDETGTPDRELSEDHAIKRIRQQPATFCNITLYMHYNGGRVDSPPLVSVPAACVKLADCKSPGKVKAFILYRELTFKYATNRNWNDPNICFSFSPRSGLRPGRYWSCIFGACTRCKWCAHFILCMRLMLHCSRT